MIEFEESITTDDMKIKSFNLDYNGVTVLFKSSKNLLFGDLVETIIKDEKIVFKVSKICSDNSGTLYEANFIKSSESFIDKYIKTGLLSYDDFLGSKLHKSFNRVECVYVIVDGYRKINENDLISLKRQYKANVITISAICIYAEGIKDFVKTFLKNDNSVIVLATKDERLINYFCSNCKEQYKGEVVFADF